MCKHSGNDRIYKFSVVG